MWLILAAILATFAATTTTTAAAPATQPNDMLVRAMLQADRIAVCSYDQKSGFFDGEGWWQSGNTIESLSTLMIAANSPRWVGLIENTYQRTPDIVDNCYDDHQWWLLAWVRAFELTNTSKYLQRAAKVFDFTVEHAWTDTQCGGGVVWCPTLELTHSRLQAMGTSPLRTGAVNGLYKNAITNELFLASAMGLHPYAQALGRPRDFYLTWAQREWSWFQRTGMISPATSLVSDGLTDACVSNNQTTWTYNQGVLLDGLTKLTVALGDRSYAQVAASVALAASRRLSQGGVFTEPCTNCDQDQHLFKGIFVRHLAYAAPILRSYFPTILDFFTVINCPNAFNIRFSMSRTAF